MKGASGGVNACQRAAEIKVGMGGNPCRAVGGKRCRWIVFRGSDVTLRLRFDLAAIVCG